MNSFFASQVECKGDAPYLKEKTLRYNQKILQNRACFTCFICTSDAVHCVNVRITLYR